MSLRWYTNVIDCHDIHAQARWWADTLDWQIVYEAADEVVIIPKYAEEEPFASLPWERVPPGLTFVPVPEDKTIKNRLHMDFAPHLNDDRDSIIAGLIERGAALADVGQPEDATFTVLRDPEGNEFCVLSARDR